MFSKYFKVHGEQHIAQEAYIAVSMYTAYRWAMGEQSAHAASDFSPLHKHFVASSTTALFHLLQM